MYHCRRTLIDGLATEDRISLEGGSGNEHAHQNKNLAVRAFVIIVAGFINFVTKFPILRCDPAAAELFNLIELFGLDSVMQII